MHSSHLVNDIIHHVTSVAADIIRIIVTSIAISMAINMATSLVTTIITASELVGQTPHRRTKIAFYGVWDIWAVLFWFNDLISGRTRLFYGLYPAWYWKRIVSPITTRLLFGSNWTHWEVMVRWCMRRIGQLGFSYLRSLVHAGYSIRGHLFLTSFCTIYHSLGRCTTFSTGLLTRRPGFTAIV